MQQLLKYVSINTILLTLLVSVLGYGIVNYYLQKPDPYEVPIGALPVPVQVGKNKLIVSKTGDASMRTEYNRRKTIIGSNKGGVSPKFSYSGSTNGSLETYFLSSICPSFVKDLVQSFRPNVVDGGNAQSEFTTIVDGNESYEIIIEGGTSTTNIPYLNKNVASFKC